MVPAALIIIVVGIVGLVLWLEDRRELRRVKRDVQALRSKVDQLMNIVASK